MLTRAKKKSGKQIDPIVHTFSANALEKIKNIEIGFKNKKVAHEKVLRAIMKIRNCQCTMEINQLGVKEFMSCDSNVYRRHLEYKSKCKTERKTFVVSAIKIRKMEKAFGTKLQFYHVETFAQEQFKLCIACFCNVHGIGQSTYVSRAKDVKLTQHREQNHPVRPDHSKSAQPKIRAFLKIQQAMNCITLLAAVGEVSPASQSTDTANVKQHIDLVETSIPELQQSINEKWPHTKASESTVTRALDRLNATSKTHVIKLRDRKEMGRCATCITLDTGVEQAKWQAKQDVASGKHAGSIDDHPGHKLAKELKRYHGSLQTTEREKLSKHITKASLKSARYHCLLIDGMDKHKTKLPHAGYETGKKATSADTTSRLNVHVIGALSYGTPFPYIMFHNFDDNYSGGANQMSTLLHSWVAIQTGAQLPGSAPSDVEVIVTNSSTVCIQIKFTQPFANNLVNLHKYSVATYPNVPFTYQSAVEPDHKQRQFMLNLSIDPSQIASNQLYSFTVSAHYHKFPTFEVDSPLRACSISNPSPPVGLTSSLSLLSMQLPPPLPIPRVASHVSVDTLYIQLDGASENKSFQMFGMLAMLVYMGVYRKVKVNYLIVGHTHNVLDQTFRCFST